MILDSMIFLCGGCIMMLLVYLLRADDCRVSQRGLIAFCAAARSGNIFPGAREMGCSLKMKFSMGLSAVRDILCTV